MGILHNINGLTNAGHTRTAPAHRPRSDEQHVDGATGDSLELSQTALRLTGVDEIADVRTAKVDRVRRQIAQGDYESTHKLDTTIDRLFAELSAVDVHA